MMKNILIFLLICFAAPVHAMNICGPVVNHAEIAYTTAVATSMINGNILGSWAVGTGCSGETTTTNIDQMCTNVTAGGQSICDSSTWSMYQYDRNEGEFGIGPFCQCRRTKMTSNGTLVYSIGQWVLLGQFSDPDACYQNCAKLCAETVTNNENGLRNAIMLLSAF